MEQEQDAHQKYFLDLGLEKWLPHVEDLSFKTISIPLSQDEAKLIRACYEHLHSGAMAASTLPPDLCMPLAALSHRLVPALESLAKRNASAAVFAKLSGRSSKDAPLHTAQLDVNLAANLAVANAAPMDENARLICLFDAALSVMKVSDLAHLLWLLVNSQRVDEDLYVALRHPERFDQCIVLREWWDGVSTDLEFRMFCVDGTPTGLTQYNHLVYSARLSVHGSTIAAALVQFYETHVRSRLEGTAFFREVGGRYTCDFALAPQALALLDQATDTNWAVALGPEHVKLIELNCFYEATGMGLFDYNADKERLTNGPFEWRVRHAPMPQAAVKLKNEWRGVLKTTPEPRRVTDEARVALADALSQQKGTPPPATDTSVTETAAVGASESPSPSAPAKQHTTVATLPPAALASLPAGVKEASIVIMHVDGDSMRVGCAGTSEPSIAKMPSTGTWHDEENLRLMFAELEPERCVLFLVVAGYRAHLAPDVCTTLFLFESLQFAGFYYDDPASCARCCPPDAPAEQAAWRGAEAISALSDFLEHAVIWRAMYEDYGPEIMKRAGGCRGGRYNQLVPLRQPDGSLRNPAPGWLRVGGY